MITMASQMTSLTVVYSTVYSDANQRKHQSSASQAFVWEIHRDRWISRTKRQLRGKCFHLMTSSWISLKERRTFRTIFCSLSLILEMIYWRLFYSRESNSIITDKKHFCVLCIYRLQIATLYKSNSSSGHFVSSNGDYCLLFTVFLSFKSRTLPT